MLRIGWDDLPEGVRDAIELQTGPVLKAETTAAGLNSALATFLRTPTGMIFVKGLRSDHPGVVTQQREAMINPYVLQVTPRLLWQVHAGPRRWVESAGLRVHRGAARRLLARF